jgi:hypothetical protein
MALVQFSHQIRGVDTSPSLPRRLGEGDFPMTENARNLIDGIRKGDPIECSAEDYRSEIRAAIILYALDCADSNDGVRMRIALTEVNRLDKQHGCGPSTESSYNPT